jgi:hypothetical protein
LKTLLFPATRFSDETGCSVMPTILRSGPYRFYFYAGDRHEPKHVHMERDDKVAKSWLEPVQLARGGGFGRVELGRMEFLIGRHHSRLVEAWNDYFGD